MLAIEPTDRTQASEPAEPTDKIEPAEPIDKMDPLDPMDRIDPLEPILRIDPDEPAEREEPLLIPMASLCRNGWQTSRPWGWDRPVGDPRAARARCDAEMVIAALDARPRLTVNHAGVVPRCRRR